MNGEQTMQFEGKTVDHAIQLACEHFKCTKDDLEITIITKGSTGLFGLGGKKAKIEVSYKGVGEQVLPEETAAAHEAVDDKDEKPVEEETAAKEESPADKDEMATEENGEGARVQEEAIPPEILEMAQEILNEILTLARLEGKVVCDRDDPQFPLKIEGEDASLFIGREGQTLDALEYILNRAVHKRNGNKGPQIHIDTQDYRIKRIENLRHMALRNAKKAKSSGRQVVLQPMSPRDRRIVHITLKDFHGVSTKSVGEGSWKKVIIVPKRRRGRPHRSRFNG